MAANNTSGIPNNALAFLAVPAVPGIPHVPVVRVFPAGGVYRRSHNVAGLVGLPVMTADARLRVAAEFFSERNITEAAVVMCSGLERLALDNDLQHFEFNLLPVQDTRINVNQDAVPSIDSLNHCRQEIPGPELLNGFPNLDLAIYQFWEGNVMAYQAVPVYGGPTANTTWFEHMQLCDAALYRAVYQTIPNQVLAVRGHLARAQNNGGPDLARHFKTSVCNLIATTIFKYVACLVSTDGSIERLDQMLQSRVRGVVEAYLLVVVPYGMKCCKVMNKYGISLREILRANVRDKVLKDCYTRSKKHGVWSLDGLMPRIQATQRRALGLPFAGQPFNNIGPDRHICKGIYYPFLRLWRHVGRDDMEVKQGWEHITRQEEADIDTEFQAEAGPVQPLQAAPVWVITAPPAGFATVQRLPPVPMAPLNLIRWTG